MLEQYWKDFCIHEKDKDKIDQMYYTIQAEGRETICAKVVPKICWTCSLCHSRSQSLVLTHVARNSWKCKIMFSFFADFTLAWMGSKIEETVDFDMNNGCFLLVLITLQGQK